MSLGHPVTLLHTSSHMLSFSFACSLVRARVPLLSLLSLPHMSTLPSSSSLCMAFHPPLPLLETHKHTSLTHMHPLTTHHTILHSSPRSKSKTPTKAPSPACAHTLCTRPPWHIHTEPLERIHSRRVVDGRVWVVLTLVRR